MQKQRGINIIKNYVGCIVFHTLQGHVLFKT
jgi:hypothetical protein